MADDPRNVLCTPPGQNSPRHRGEDFTFAMTLDGDPDPARSEEAKFVYGKTGGKSSSKTPACPVDDLVGG